MDIHAVVDIIKAIQENPETNSDDLFQVEWAFLPLLDHYDRGYPKLLEHRMANDPAFFCEVVRAIFRSKNEEPSVDEPSEQKKNIAKNAYLLLSNWRTPPGTQEDGTYNDEALAAWLQDVKSLCAESGHLQIALIMLGHVLVYAPVDPDGLWLRHSVAKVLNAKDADKIREGFTTELLNSRGVFTWSAGKAERDLAVKYRGQADKIEAGGYHRLADSLRSLANSYDRMADHEASREQFDD